VNHWLTLPILCVALFSQCSPEKSNAPRFCRDYGETGCVGASAGDIAYSLAGTNTHGTVLNFANSIYFRGDRLILEVQNIHASIPITPECLHGHYAFEDGSQTHELEYTELRGKNAHGLVMTGSLIEKKFLGLRDQKYRPLGDFNVVFSLNCGSETLGKARIKVQLR
jgi:hypothetical protein